MKRSFTLACMTSLLIMSGCSEDNSNALPGGCIEASVSAACEAANMDYDAANCTCKAKSSICNAAVVATNCSASGMDFDAATCSCKPKAVTPTCDTAAKIVECAQAGMEFDAETCNCKSATAACTANRCDGSKLVICINGTEATSIDCPFGCDSSENKCRSSAQICDTDAKKQECASVDKDFDADKCDCIDKTLPSTEPVAGASCDASTYEGGCSADLSKRYYCGKDGKLVEKACDSGKSCVINGGNSSDCKSSGGSESTTEPVAGAECDASTYEGGCSADLSKRYYCNSKTGKLVEKTCDSGKSCVISGNNISTCKASDSSTIPSVTTGGNVGDTCTSSTYTPSCINNNANALICSAGKVKQWSCDLTACSYDSSTNRVKCETSASTTTQCDASTYPGECAADKASGTFCNAKGQLVTKTCGTGTSCSVTGQNYVACTTGTSVTTGGNVGDGCDSKTYVPTCTNNNANALVCASGAVKEWTCAENQCSYDASTNKVTCPNPNGSGSGGSSTITYDDGTGIKLEDECSKNKEGQSVAACNYDSDEGAYFTDYMTCYKFDNGYFWDVSDDYKYDVCKGKCNKGTSGNACDSSGFTTETINSGYEDCDDTCYYDDNTTCKAYCKSKGSSTCLMDDKNFYCE